MFCGTCFLYLFSFLLFRSATGQCCCHCSSSAAQDFVSEINLDPQSLEFSHFCVLKQQNNTHQRNKYFQWAVLGDFVFSPVQKQDVTDSQIKSGWHRASWLSLPQRLKLGSDIWLWLCLSPAVVVIWWLSRRIREDLNTPGYLVHKIVLFVLWRKSTELQFRATGCSIWFRCD